MNTIELTNEHLKEVIGVISSILFEQLQDTITLRDEQIVHTAMVYAKDSIEDKLQDGDDEIGVEIDTELVKGAVFESIVKGLISIYLQKVEVKMHNKLSEGTLSKEQVKELRKITQDSLINAVMHPELYATEDICNETVN